MASLTEQTESEQTLRDSKGQGSLACCSSRGCKELDMTEQPDDKDLLYSTGNSVLYKINYLGKESKTRWLYL